MEKKTQEDHFYELGKIQGRSERNNKWLVIGLSLGFTIGFALCYFCEYFNL